MSAKQEIPQTFPAEGLYSCWSRVDTLSEEGRLTSSATEALIKEFEEYLHSGWRKVPMEIDHAISHMGSGFRETVATTIEDTLRSVQHFFDEVVDWKSPNALGVVRAAVPGFISRSLSTLLASRLLEQDDRGLQAEMDVIREVLRVAMWNAALREAMARHNLSPKEAAPAAIAASAVLIHDKDVSGQPTRLRVGTEDIPITTPPTFFASVVAAESDIDDRLLSESGRVVEAVQQVTQLPDLSLIASYEQDHFGIDRKQALIKVVESLFRAHRESEGRARDSLDCRVGFARGGFVAAANTLCEQTSWAKAVHSTYTQARKYIISERERAEEFEKKRQQRGGKGGAPVHIEYPIPNGFDAITAFGLFLQDSILHGDPLSLTWGFITDWGESKLEGGFNFSQKEGRELIDLTAHTALLYASEFSVDNDPFLDRLIQNSGKHFLREQFREIELELRQMAHLSDDEMMERARSMMERVPSAFGENDKEKLGKYLRAVDGMIDRIRAHSEVHRLLAHRALVNDAPVAIIQNLNALPHARRFGKRVRPLWLQQSFTGQTRLDLLTDVKNRVYDYRRRARREHHNVQYFGTPTDRWDRELSRRLGRFRPPEFTKSQKVSIGGSDSFWFKTTPVERPQPRRRRKRYR